MPSRGIREGELILVQGFKFHGTTRRERESGMLRSSPPLPFFGSGRKEKKQYMLGNLLSQISYRPDS